MQTIWHIDVFLFLSNYELNKKERKKKGKKKKMNQQKALTTILWHNKITSEDSHLKYTNINLDFPQKFIMHGDGLMFSARSTRHPFPAKEKEATSYHLQLRSNQKTRNSKSFNKMLATPWALDFDIHFPHIFN